MRAPVRYPEPGQPEIQSGFSFRSARSADAVGAAQAAGSKLPAVYICRGGKAIHGLSVSVEWSIISSSHSATVSLVMYYYFTITAPSSVVQEENTEEEYFLKVKIGC
ncbi:hypothetical protein LDENG_00097370 [Lucifuga dentata]|nr:hypothetical protein LDENG_00097370 [Lucifuga dentata]